MKSGRTVLVLGAGAWGTALALVLTRNPGNDVILWGRDPQAIADMRSSRRNAKYLPGIELSASLQLVDDADLPAAVDTVVAVVPFQTLRPVLTELRTRIDTPNCIACASKGIENATFALADEIVADVFPKTTFAMLSGPNFAIEVAEQRPAAITVAVRDPAHGRELVRRLHSPAFRPYLTDDVTGVQIGGAIKNVIAIAAGISDGLGLGSNSRAALITRGLAEITRFGVARGGRLETFMGLSGLGDLVLTCTDDKSRNRRFGLSLAAGTNPQHAIEKTGLVEGATTALALAEFARRNGVEMPISCEVADTISGKTTPRGAVDNLLARDPVEESLGIEPG
jgi:glycerol-3-phosphate dehydrogenase (NAD(P)+)